MNKRNAREGFMSVFTLSKKNTLVAIAMDKAPIT